MHGLPPDFRYGAPIEILFARFLVCGDVAETPSDHFGPGGSSDGGTS